MILYMDVYITDTPLFRNLYDELADLRSKSKIWNAPSKVDVTLYTLASYTLYKWSNVVIKYELEDKSKYDYFESEVKKLFPDAILIRGRSDTQEKYLESIKLLEKLGDDWIFYCGNNDHPFVLQDIKIIDVCLAKAKELKRLYPRVSIFYSHMLEAAPLLEKESHFSKILNQNGFAGSKIIYEDTELIATLRNDGGFFPSAQILPLSLFKDWFLDKALAGKRVRRSDDLRGLVSFPGQVLLLPKRQICEHFDGYGNLDSLVGFKVNEAVPPLFFPPGFFENDIKIAYCYEEYRENWVNVNPFKKRYSFVDQKNGTDMRISLSRLPLFWKGRISKIEINPKADQQEAERLGQENYEKICNPWPKSAVSVYLTKFLISPLWRLRKFLWRTALYFKDPTYLEENLNAGSPFFVAYKKALLSIIRVFGIKKKGG